MKAKNWKGVRVTVTDGQCRLLPIPPRGPQALRPSWPHALTLLCPLSAGGQQPLADCSVPLELSTTGIPRPHSWRSALASFADLRVPSCHKAAHHPPCPGPSLSHCLPVTVSPSPSSVTICALTTPSFPHQPRLPPKSLRVTPHRSLRGPFSSPWSRQRP